MVSAELQIGGMTCAACAGAVEAALLAVPGVKAASVSLMTANGRIEFDSRLTSVPILADAVSAAGYAAEPVAADAVLSGPDYAAEARAWFSRFVCTLPLTVPVFLLSMVPMMIVLKLFLFLMSSRTIFNRRRRRRRRKNRFQLS